MRVLVTGATGWVGRALLERVVVREGWRARGSHMKPDAALPSGVEARRVAPLSAETDWTAALECVDVVVHTAARVHVMDEMAADPETEYQRANLDGTVRLAREAVRFGVRRLVFVSSIKVNGECTLPGRPFTELDSPAPSDAYGRSKAEAERQLAIVAAETGLELVIVRPVMIYGPGVRANFLSLLHWVHRGLPLPLAGIQNARSLAALDNVVDLLVSCAIHPAAAGGTFLAADGEDVSTPELLERTAGALGTRARLFAVPPAWLGGAGRLLGQAQALSRLTDSLQADISAARSRLRWTPPVRMDDALRQTAEWFLSLRTAE
jgi:UDP-4-keto-D-QuiNAc 4-reductase